MPILEFFMENETKYPSYNICPDISTSLIEVAELVKQISDENIDIIVKNEGFGYDYTGCNSRLHKEFNDLKFTDLKLSLYNLYKYYETNKQNINKALLLEDK